MSFCWIMGYFSVIFVIIKLLFSFLYAVFNVLNKKCAFFMDIVYYNMVPCFWFIL